MEITQKELEKVFDDVRNEWVQRADKHKLESAKATMNFVISLTKEEVIKRLFDQ